MVLLSCKNILPDSGVYHPDLLEDKMEVIDMALVKKYKEDSVITKE